MREFISGIIFTIVGIFGIILRIILPSDYSAIGSFLMCAIPMGVIQLIRGYKKTKSAFVALSKGNEYYGIIVEKNPYYGDSKIKVIYFDDKSDCNKESYYVTEGKFRNLNVGECLKIKSYEESFLILERDVMLNTLDKDIKKKMMIIKSKDAGVAHLYRENDEEFIYRNGIKYKKVD